MPLNYSFDLSNLTQLFGRSLQLKYFNKKADFEPKVPTDQIINEEGDIINESFDEGPDCGSPDVQSLVAGVEEVTHDIFGFQNQ